MSLTFESIKILGISAIATVAAFAWSPLLIDFLYRKKCGRKRPGKQQFLAKKP